MVGSMSDKNPRFEARKSIDGKTCVVVETRTGDIYARYLTKRTARLFANAEEMAEMLQVYKANLEYHQRDSCYCPETETGCRYCEEKFRLDALLAKIEVKS